MYVLQGIYRLYYPEGTLENSAPLQLCGIIHIHL